MGIWNRIIGRSSGNVVGDAGDGVFSDVALAELSARLERMSASVIFDEQRRDALRGRLMSRLASSSMRECVHLGEETHADLAFREDLARVAAWMRAVATSVVMPAAAVARIRERLYALPSPSFLRRVWEGSMRRGVMYRFGSALAIVALLAVATFSFAVQAPVTFASSVNIYEVTGDVSVMRGGAVIPAAVYLALQSGDVIRTGESGKVVVNYFDTSFTRVFEGSNVVLQRVTSDDFGLTNSVGIDVVAGKMWSRVGDLVSDSDFTVRARDIVASTNKRAVFFVSADEQRASLQVFQHEVSVMLPKHDAPKTVSKGYQAVAEQSRAVVQPIRATDADQAFVAGNLSQDHQVLAQVDAAKTTDDGVLSPLKDTTSLLLTLSASDRERLSLKFAERDFYDALKHEEVIDAATPKSDSSVSDPVEQAFAHLRDVTKSASESDVPDVQRLAATVLDRAHDALPETVSLDAVVEKDAVTDDAAVGLGAVSIDDHNTVDAKLDTKPDVKPDVKFDVKPEISATENAKASDTTEDVPEMVLPPKVQLGRE